MYVTNALADLIAPMHAWGTSVFPGKSQIDGSHDRSAIIDKSVSINCIFLTLRDTFWFRAKWIPGIVIRTR